MVNPNGNPKIAEHGKATQFSTTERGCNAVDGAEKSNEVQREKKEEKNELNKVIDSVLRSLTNLAIEQATDANKQQVLKQIKEVSKLDDAGILILEAGRIATDRKSKPFEKLKAIEMLLERRFGKPTLPVDLGSGKGKIIVKF